MMDRVNIGLGIVNVLIISLLVAWFLNSCDRMVYVDSNKLVNGYKYMQDAKKAYQQKATQWKANVDTLTSELQAVIMKYENEVGAMTAKEKSLSQELSRQKQKQFNKQ
jgi:outer membrane protein